MKETELRQRQKKPRQTLGMQRSNRPSLKKAWQPKRNAVGSGGMPEQSEVWACP